MPSRPRVLVRRIAAPALVVASTACGDVTQPESGPESLAALTVTAPVEVPDGEPFDLVVTARGSDGSEPFPFAGAVDLTVSDGSIRPASVDLSSGTTTRSVTVSGTAGPVVVTAAAGGVSGSATIESLLLARIPGEPGAEATSTIPVRRYDPSRAAFSVDPDGPEGAETAHDVVAVQLSPGATVADVNAMLERVDATIIGSHPGAGTGLGLLVLGLPTPDHAALDAVITDLESDATVARVLEDLLIGTESTPPSGTDVPASWAWESTPTGGNWGLELMRAPQMWNLNERVDLVPARTNVEVIDVGFAAAHADLDWQLIDGPGPSSDHGTHVAGIIGAEFGNGVGTDGVTPYASLRGQSVPTRPDLPDTPSTSVAALLALYAAVDRPDPRVVNVSLGLNWWTRGIDPAASPRWQSALARWSVALTGFLDALRGLGVAPLIVAAAGNDSDPDSNQGIGQVDAKYSSPLAYAALEYGAPEILVVEALRRDGSVPGGATRATYSNHGGHLSAPGSAVLSTVANGYGWSSGTSMAAPHVTGLIAHLFAVDPGLTNADVRDILLGTAVEIDGGDTAPRVDAFAAVMDIDRIRGGDTVLRQLLDIDDGTPDGNQRTTIDGTFTNDDADGDGAIGDGSIDMSDFRRFRDWLLQASNDAAAQLDGGLDHPKKDINDDGEVGLPEEENVYPRGDFNGDGRLHETATAMVGGAVGVAATDLAVLQREFSDPHYQAAELPNLIQSADLTVDLSQVLELEGVVGARLTVSRHPDGPLVHARSVADDEPIQVVTVPVHFEGHDVRVIALDGQQESLGEGHEWFNFGAAEDVRWVPGLTPTLVIQLTVPSQADTDQPFPVSARVGLQPPLGDIEHRSGVTVNFEATGGTVSPAAVLTDADGFVSAEGAFLTGSELVTLTARASYGSLEPVYEIDTVEPLAAGGVTVDSMSVAGHTQLAIAHAAAYDSLEDPEWQDDTCEDGLPERRLDPDAPHAYAFQCSASASNGNASASAQASYNLAIHAISDSNGALHRVEWSGSGSATGAGNEGDHEPNGSYSGGGAGSAGTSVIVNFTVAEPATMRVAGMWDVPWILVRLRNVLTREEQELVTGLVPAGSLDEQVALDPGEYDLFLSHGVHADSGGQLGPPSAASEVGFTFTFGGS